MKQHNRHDKDIEALINAAGARETPPESMRERIYAATKSAWEELPAKDATDSAPPVDTPPPVPVRSGWGWLAAAASVFVALIAGVVVMNDDLGVPQESIARVVLVNGDVRLNGRTATNASAVELGAHFTTHANSLGSFELQSGALVTLDQQTQLEVVGPSILYLSTGRVFVDSQSEQEHITVRTPLSTIVDIGTQFEVHVKPDSQVVGVREGRIEMTTVSNSAIASAVDATGEMLRYDGTANIERRPIATTDPHWNWRKLGRPSFVLEGASVYDYVQWMARDNGCRIEFASNGVGHYAKLERLRLRGPGGPGTSDDFTIEEVLDTTRFKLDRSQPGKWIVDFNS